MTKFIDVSKVKYDEEKTVFEYQLLSDSGWGEPVCCLNDFVKVIYLGKCKLDGDMFAAYDTHGTISIFKGTKGSEFK